MKSNKYYLSDLDLESLPTKIQKEIAYRNGMQQLLADMLKGESIDRSQQPYQPNTLEKELIERLQTHKAQLKNCEKELKSIQADRIKLSQ